VTSASIPMIGPIVGIAGWKKSGKTTLVERLIAEFTRRGKRVASVKHAHHAFQIDDAETDSARHRRAGAAQVAVVSRSRWAIVTELAGAAEPDLAQIIARLDPCDLIIVEGYKRAAIPKIEVRRAAALSHERLADSDPSVIAIAADHAVEGGALPVFLLDDIAGLADFIVQAVGAGAPTPAGAEGVL
jgi:molybdopterin-guanine dinucleotide biosynthesis adapter protein